MGYIPHSDCGLCGVILDCKVRMITTCIQVCNVTAIVTEKDSLTGSENCSHLGWGWSPLGGTVSVTIRHDLQQKLKWKV
jgi:hypothetical protein